MGPLLDVKEGRQQDLNLMSTLQIFMDNIVDTNPNDIDDDEMHHDWWWFDSYAIVAWVDKAIKIGISSLITNMGISLKSLLIIEPDLAFTKEVADSISKKLSCRVSVHEPFENGIRKTNIYEKTN